MATKSVDRSRTFQMDHHRGVRPAREAQPARTPRDGVGHERAGTRSISIQTAPKVVVAGIHAESNPRSDRPIRRADFREAAGPALLEHEEFAGLFPADATLVGGYRARAASGGYVEPAALEALTERLVAHVAAVEGVEGILLCTHGALRTQADADADGTWIAAVRAAVPRTVPIVGVFDTHGTPSLRTLAALDGVATYRTVPHVDQGAAMRRALSQLRRRIDGEACPHVVFEPVPLRLAAERAGTRQGPLREAIEQLALRPRGVVDADVFIGQAWAPANVPTVGVVAIGTDEPEARAWARRIAGDLWRRRHAFDYDVPALDLDGVSARLERLGGARLVIADSGDVPGAGAHGDRLDVLDVLSMHGAVRSLVVGAAIPEWLRACAGRSTGARVEVVHPITGRRYRASIAAPERTLGAYGRCVVLAMGHVDVLVVERRGDPPDPALLEAIDLRPDAHQVIALKTGFIPDAYLVGREPLLALSPGITDHRSIVPDGQGA